MNTPLEMIPYDAATQPDELTVQRIRRAKEEHKARLNGMEARRALLTGSLFSSRQSTGTDSPTEL